MGTESVISERVVKPRNFLLVIGILAFFLAYLSAREYIYIGSNALTDKNDLSGIAFLIFYCTSGFCAFVLFALYQIREVIVQDK